MSTKQDEQKFWLRRDDGKQLVLNQHRLKGFARLYRLNAKRRRWTITTCPPDSND